MAAIAHGEADPHRPEYVKIFQAHAARLAALAGEDGAWGPSLLNRRDYPLGESTATAGFVYGLAFGKGQRSCGQTWVRTARQLSAGPLRAQG